MAGVNKVILVGNLGKDPEMKYTQNGAAVTTFSLAVSQTMTVNGEKKESTEWFNIVAWNKQAELCDKYLSKGQTVYVEGRLQTRNWDGQDGQKHYKTEVVVQTIQFLSKGEKKQEAAPSDDPEEWSF